MKTRIFANKEIFKRARLEKGYSQGKLAKMAGVTRQYVSNIEMQRSSVSPGLGTKLSEILEEEYKELFFVQIINSSEEYINSNEVKASQKA